MPAAADLQRNDGFPETQEKAQGKWEGRKSDERRKGEEGRGKREEEEGNTRQGRGRNGGQMADRCNEAHKQGLQMQMQMQRQMRKREAGKIWLGLVPFFGFLPSVT
jgi:hypothetical protein